MSRPLVEPASTSRVVLRLALPVLAEQVLGMLVAFSDTLLAGRYFAAEHLAAVNMVAYLLWLVQNLAVVVSIGATAMVARFVGAGQAEQARHVANQALLLGAALAAVLTLAATSAAPAIVALSGLAGRSAELLAEYLRIVAPWIGSVMLVSVGVACLRGAGNMLAGLALMAVVNVVNVGVAWPLVLGLGPLPQLGWRGLAVGVAAGYATGLVLLVAMLARPGAPLRIGAALLWPQRDLIRRLLRIGLPGGADILLLIGCQIWFVMVINRLGDLAAAAHGVAIKVESLAYLPPIAFEVAAATLVGQFLGAGDPRRAARSALLACLGAAAITITMGVLFLAAPEELVRIFVRGDETAVIELAAGLLRIVAVVMPALAPVMVFSGALRGAGDTRWPLLFTFIGFLGVRMPLAYLLAYQLGWGVRGAWLAMVADVVVRAVLVSGRFWHGGWQRVRV